MSETTFAVGDHVFVLGKFFGDVKHIDPDSHFPYIVADAFGEIVGSYHARDLVRVDAVEPLPLEPAIGMVHTTTRRMRVNIAKNTKGYNFDHTFEIESDDPDLDLAAAMREGLRQGDRAAREAIAEAEYTDANGLPGSDDIDTDAF